MHIANIIADISPQSQFHTFGPSPTKPYIFAFFDFKHISFYASSHQASIQPNFCDHVS